MWYAETKSHNGKPVPSIVCGTKPTTDKTSSGSPSPYVRVEEIPTRFGENPSLDELFAHFNPSSPETP